MTPCPFQNAEMTPCPFLVTPIDALLHFTYSRKSQSAVIGAETTRRAAFPLFYSTAFVIVDRNPTHYIKTSAIGQSGSACHRLLHNAYPMESKNSCSRQADKSMAAISCLFFVLPFFKDWIHFRLRLCNCCSA